MIFAQMIVYGTFLYLAFGAFFALWFVIFGIGDFDDAAKDSGYGFRIIVFFGAAALWVFLLPRILNRRTDDA